MIASDAECDAEDPPATASTSAITKSGAKIARYFIYPSSKTMNARRQNAEGASLPPCRNKQQERLHARNSSLGRESNTPRKRPVHVERSTRARMTLRGESACAAETPLRRQHHESLHAVRRIAKMPVVALRRRHRSRTALRRRRGGLRLERRLHVDDELRRRDNRRRPTPSPRRKRASTSWETQQRPSRIRRSPGASVT